MKNILIFTIVGLLILTSTREVYAQALEFDRAYQDYLFNRTQFDQSYAEYQSAKNAYIGNPTLSLKDVAKQKTFVMLQKRDQMMAVYLTSIRTKISELSGLDKENKDPILAKLDSEIVWYKDHKNNYKDTDSLETLFEKNSEAEKRYNDVGIFIVYDGLFNITLGEQQGLRMAHEDVFSRLNEVINSRVVQGTLTLSPFDNWFKDITTTIDALKTNEALGKTQIQKLYTKRFNPESAYLETIRTMDSSVAFLSRLNEYLTEVLTYIKNN